VVVTRIDYCFSPRTFLQLKEHFTDGLIIWNLDVLALPETLGAFGHIIHFVTLFLLLSFVCLG